VVLAVVFEATVVDPAGAAGAAVGLPVGAAVGLPAGAAVAGVGLPAGAAVGAVVMT